MIEICTFSLASSLVAQQGGADRIELCGGMAEGGTTPSAGLIKLVREQLAIKVYVMIRPRGGDFCYSPTEFEVMKEDIRIAKNRGVDGVVFGILLPSGKVDVARTRELVELAKPMGVTFHRAFDMAIEPFEALEAVIDCGCERILTSGQRRTALEGKEVLAQLVQKANHRIEIMAGSGVNEANAEELIVCGVDSLHLTAKAKHNSPMEFKQAHVSMANETLGEYELFETNLEKCQAVIEKWNQSLKNKI